LTEQEAKVNDTDDLKDVPTTLDEILTLEGEGKTLYDVFSILLGAHIKDILDILERTDLTPHEVDVVSDALQLAQHGIGGDIPEFNQKIPELFDWILIKCRARVSRNRESRKEFERALQNIKIRFAREKQDQSLVGG